MVASPRILIALDAFKGSMTAPAACETLRRGLCAAAPRAEVTCLPVADGGEGTGEALLSACGGRRHGVATQDALGRRIDAAWVALHTGAGVVELAAASGIERLTAAERDPCRTSTYGTGLLLRAALDAGCRDVMLTLGGSATVDGGCGLLEALGVRWLDAQGVPLPRGGGALQRLHRIDAHDVHPALHGTRLRILCDVDNPLLGPRGAAAVFAPQKGADAAAVAQLGRGLTRLADVLLQATGRRVHDMPGCGAAGGVAAPLVAMCGAQLCGGAEAVLDALGLQQALAAADLVVTGEGCLDAQSAAGKAPVAVARAARRAGVPCVAAVGDVNEPLPRAVRDLFLRIETLCAHAGSREHALRESGHWMEHVGRAIGTWWSA